MQDIITNIIGVLFVCTGILDGVKYKWNADKIRQVRTSRGHSRQFINVALLNDVVRTSYGFMIGDWYIVISSLFAMVFMIDLFVTIYTFYPYKNRNKTWFKKPNIFEYFINSILPNSISKKL